MYANLEEYSEQDNKISRNHMPMFQNKIKYDGRTQNFDFFNKLWEIRNDLFSKEERKREKISEREKKIRKVSNKYSKLEVI